MPTYTTEVDNHALSTVVSTMKGKGATSVLVSGHSGSRSIVEFSVSPEEEDAVLDYLGDQGMTPTQKTASRRRASVQVGDEMWEIFNGGQSPVVVKAVNQSSVTVQGKDGKTHRARPDRLIPKDKGDSSIFNWDKEMGRSASRKAAPNEMSGHNPNTPIRTYDTHPNEYFEEGDVVIPLDPEEPPVTGTVLARIAEDRLLVDWGRVTAQEDVDDVIKASEWNFMNSSHNIGATNRPRRPTKMNLTRRASAQRRVQVAFFGGRQAQPQDGRVAFWNTMPTWMGGKGEGLAQRPQWMGGHGSFNTQFDQQAKEGTTPNQLKMPAIRDMLLKAGMNPRVLDQLSGALDKLQGLSHQNALAKYRQDAAKTNEAAGQGDFSGLNPNAPKKPGFQFGGDSLGGRNIRVKPNAQSTPHIAPQPRKPAIAPGTVPFGGTYPVGHPDLMPAASRVIRKAALTRKAGLQELIFQASALDALGEGAASYTVRQAADVAAAMHDLYRTARSRHASKDLSRQAMKSVCAAVLEATSRLRRIGYEEPANAVENALVASMTYERLPRIAKPAQLAPMSQQPAHYQQGTPAPAPRGRTPAKLAPMAQQPAHYQPIDWKVVQSAAASGNAQAKQMMALATAAKQNPQNRDALSKQAKQLWGAIQSQMAS